MPNTVNSTRRDLLLDQMGISQYELRRPMALQGEVAVTLPDQIRLVIIAGQAIDINTPLLIDILRSMSISANQIYCLTPEQAPMLPPDYHQALWLMGELKLPDNVKDKERLLTSPILDHLADDPAAKRTLWQQICQHEHYFSANPS